MPASRKGVSLRTYAKTLEQLPRVAAIKVAERGAGKISTAARESFDAGRTADDQPRPLGTRGNEVDLVVSGDLRATALRFLHDGTTRIRAALRKRYHGVMVGRFGVLPGARLPAKWRQLLGLTANGVLTEEARP
jgi:hypothetical protein